MEMNRQVNEKTADVVKPSATCAGPRGMAAGVSQNPPHKLLDSEQRVGSDVEEPGERVVSNSR